MSTADASADNTNVSGEAAEHNDSHSHGSRKASYDDVNVTFLLVAGIVSAVLTYVIIVCVQAFFLQYDRSEITRKNYDVVNTPQTAIVDRQKALLETADFREEQLAASEEGAEPEVIQRFTIPIEDAIQMTLDAEKPDSQ